jgi:hypothetical protein
VTSTSTQTETPTETLTPALTATFTPVPSILVYPNPFNPGTAFGGTLKVTGMPPGADLYIYTVAGELAKKQPGGNGANGSTEWDGRNDWGQTVATGTYFYVVRLGDKTLAKGPLVVQRTN